MLLPEPMSRIMIVGAKSRMDEAVEAFYSVGSIHIIDHNTGDDGLSIGSTKESVSKASERLLKIRSLEKELGIKRRTKAEDIAVEDVRSLISSGEVESVEKEILSAVDARNGLAQKISELNAEKQTLTLLSRLPLTLDMYSGYRAVSSLFGTVDSLPSLNGDVEVFTDADKKKGGVIAVFFRNRDRDNVISQLQQFGFTEIQVPACDRPLSPADEMAVIEKEIEETVQAHEEQIDGLLELKAKHRSFLKGTDEELQIEVEKGSVPLRIAVGKYSYIMDAWVPTDSLDRVKAGLAEKLGGSVHIEVAEEARSRNLSDTEVQEPRFQPVPTKQRNGQIAKEFEYATSLVSRPRYQEIDPTAFVMIFLPLFFGIMVGDAGYAIPFIVLGAYGLKKTKHKDWRAIALVFFFGGMWAFLFGMFFYGEMLGMHFVGGHFEGGAWIWAEDSIANGGTNVTWDWLLGGHFPNWFCDLIGHVDADGHHVGVGKLEDVGFLLKLSVYIGLVHLFLGHMCSLYNKNIQHGVKHAFIEKGGVVLSFFGIVSFCYGLTDILFNKADLAGVTQYTLFAGIALLAIGVAVNVKAEGALQAILGLPEHIGQILSYTRLAAIAMSKAGMALAFNFIVFSMIIPTKVVDGLTMFDPGASIPLLVLGLVIFAFLHLVIWTLAILSAGIHSLRLQFVELMMRFFEGGGVEYAPLKEERSKTFFKFKNGLDNTIEVD